MQYVFNAAIPACAEGEGKPDHAVTQCELRLVALMLDRMAHLVRGNRYGRQRLVIVVVGAKTHHAVLRIIVITTRLCFLDRYIRHSEAVQQVARQLPARSRYPWQLTCIAAEGVSSPPLRAEYQHQQEQGDNQNIYEGLVNHLHQ